MKFKAVLFDLDGTLLNTLNDLADSMNATLGRLGFPEHPADAYRYFVGDGVGELCRRALPRDGADEATIKKAVVMMREEYGRRWNQKTRPYVGVPELLEELTGRRVKMAVLSNKPDDFTKLCVKQLLGSWRFDVVKGLDENIRKKPDPSGALLVARTLGMVPADFVYLGDTNTDMQTAVAAGMFPAGALWGFRTAEELTASGARVLIAKPMELLAI